MLFHSSFLHAPKLHSIINSTLQISFFLFCLLHFKGAGRGDVQQGRDAPENAPPHREPPHPPARLPSRVQERYGTVYTLFVQERLALFTLYLKDL